MLGLVAWLWNSYQNQLPYEFLGTDFWDSRLHPIGYWLTRAYKFYIWMFMIPMILHVQVVIIFRTNELLRRAKGSVQLQPFHPDRSGGASAIVRAVITPLLPSVLLGAALNFAVILVHGKIDPTTLGASIVFLATVTAFYLIPAKALRDLIAFEKRRQLELISRTQEVLYRSLLSTDGGPRAQEAVSRLSLLGDLAQRFDRLSLWPEGLRVAKAMASYVASPAAALIAKEAFAYAKQWIS